MDAKNSFKENGYLLVKGLVDPTAYYTRLKEMERQGKGSIDGNIKGARTFYKDEMCEDLLVNLLPLIEKHTGHRLYKTYSFARMYALDNILKSHRDRVACEISVTLSLGTSGKPWPIWVCDRDERPHSFLLEPGDGLIYRGNELAHWREKNIFGACAQVFLHYVDQDGQYAIHQDDKDKARFYRFPLFKKNITIRVDRIYKSRQPTQI